MKKLLCEHYRDFAENQGMPPLMAIFQANIHMQESSKGMKKATTLEEWREFADGWFIYRLTILSALTGLF